MISLEGKEGVKRAPPKLAFPHVLLNLRHVGLLRFWTRGAKNWGDCRHHPSTAWSDAVPASSIHTISIPVPRLLLTLAKSPITLVLLLPMSEHGDGPDVDERRLRGLSSTGSETFHADDDLSVTVGRILLFFFLQYEW